MNDFVIFSDAGCDLSKTTAHDLGVQCLPLELKYDNSDSSRSSDTVNAKEMYDYMRGGGVVKTSAANVDVVTRYFIPALDAGCDILYIAFSSGLSSTYNSAVIASNELKERYPDRKIIVVDTKAASLGHGLLVYKAVMMKRDGRSIDQIARWLEDNKLHMCHMFTVDDLVYLKRGGRVSAATAVVGSILGIKPVLHVDDDGHLIAVSKVRGRKASLQALVDMMKKTSYNNKDDDVFISHGDCIDDAKLLAKMVKDQLGFKNITIDMIGPTIGAHSGPGTLALFFLGEKR